MYTAWTKECHYGYKRHYMKLGSSSCCHKFSARLIRESIETALLDMKVSLVPTHVIHPLEFWYPTLGIGTYLGRGVLASRWFNIDHESSSICHFTCILKLLYLVPGTICHLGVQLVVTHPGTNKAIPWCIDTTPLQLFSTNMAQVRPWCSHFKMFVANG